MAPTYKLYAPAGSFRAFAPLIAAEYNGVEIEIATDGLEDAVKKSPTGKAPLLETPSGVIFSSQSMARFLGSIRSDTGLMGTSLQERVAIDSWIDWTAQDVELPCCVLFYPIAGYMPFNAEANTKAQDDLKTALATLDTYLTGKSYLVTNDQVTLADIVLACTLLYPFKLVCDKNFLKPYENVVRWFQSCVSQPEFFNVVGKVEMCKKALAPQAPAAES